MNNTMSNADILFLVFSTIGLIFAIVAIAKSGIKGAALALLVWGLVLAGLFSIFPQNEPNQSLRILGLVLLTLGWTGYVALHIAQGVATKKTAPPVGQEGPGCPASAEKIQS